MVVFTCNHCGDSLSKPKVEKHYMFACKRVKSLTCVDCFKDFKGEEYVSHTKCLTEDERYAAKGTTFKAQKGMVKQESWTEMIKSILDNEPNIHPSSRKLLNIISTYTNIPRKKPKFVNFIKASFGGRINLKEMEDVWNIIEKYKNDQSNSNKQSNTNAGNGELQLQESSNADTIKDSKNEKNEKKKRKISDLDVESKDVPKKKKKQAIDETPVQISEKISAVNKVFKFQDKILEVLSKKQSISLKKLQKKVLNAYLKETGETEVTPKLIKKFNKKLKKTTNLEITDDRVTLLEVPAQ